MMNTKILFLTAVLAAIVLGCNPANGGSKKATDSEARKNPATAMATAPRDTTPKVTGIGGIFFYAADAKATKAWYTQNLGVDVNPWGSASFDYNPVGHPQDTISLQWKPFKTGDAYFAPSKKDFMINYTVQNLEGLVRQFKANGVTILDTMAVYDFGKFLHIMDAEGNKIELWEPVSGK